MFKILLLVLQILIDLFVIWRVLNLDEFRLDARERLNNAESRITDLYRRHDMAPVVMGTHLCSVCNNPLPENTPRTHDGHWLCANCKAHLVPEIVK